MSEFQYFVNLVWPWFMGGLVLRVVCWGIGYSCKLVSVGLGDDNY